MKKIINYVMNKLKYRNWGRFIVLTISFLLFEIIFIFFGYDFNNLTQDQIIKMSLIKYFFFVFLLIILYRKYLLEKLKDFKNHFKEYARISFKDWGIGFLLMMIFNILISSFIKGLGENEAAIQDLISKTPFIAFFMTTFFAPFIEEMIFRKSLQDCFYNPLIFMISSGFIFGFIHVMASSNIYEYLLILSYGSLGFAFAHTLSKTDNIFCTIMMHMFHNGILTLLAVISL